MIWFPGFVLNPRAAGDTCQLSSPSVLPSIEIGNCIAVQVCMLQIPILVLFTIFYVSRPRTAPV